MVLPIINKDDGGKAIGFIETLTSANSVVNVNQSRSVTTVTTRDRRSGQVKTSPGLPANFSCFLNSAGFPINRAHRRRVMPFVLASRSKYAAAAVAGEDKTRQS